MKTARFFYLIVYCLLQITSISSQSIEIDSLKARLKENLPDSTHAQVLRTLIGVLRGSDIPEATRYARENLKLALDNGDDGLLFKAYYTLGSTYVDSYTLDSAELMGEKALEYVRKIQDPFYESFVLNLLGIINDNLNRPDKAIDYYFQSAKISESLQDTVGVYYAYANIGVLYFERSDMENCIKYLQESLKLSRELGDQEHTAMALLNLNSCYPPENYEDLKLDILSQALELSQATGRLDILTGVASNLGALYNDGFKDYDKALEYYHQGLRIAQQIGDINRESVNQNNMGLTFLNINQLDSAQYYLERGLKIAQDLQDYEEIYDANSHLSTLYYKKQDYRSAYDYYLKAVEARDSIFLVDKNESLAEAEARYQNEKKQAEITRQELEIARKTTLNNRVITISVVVFLISLLLFQGYLFRQKRLKKTSEMALQMQQLEANKLRELDRTKSRFFANLSHELRTPLTLILGPLKNALQKDPQQKDLELAHSNGEQLLSLVNEIMDLSKLESGKLSLFPNTVAANAFFKRIFFAFESLADIRNIQLDFYSGLADHLYLELDPSKVEKILNNLLSNALKFSRSGDQVRMEVNGQDGHLIIKVQDSGIGIPETELPHIFDRFFQSDQQGEQLFGGTGIGLALAKELATLHGGDLEVESILNEGSTFSLNLPLIKKDQVHIPEIEEENYKTENPFLPHSYQPILLNGQKARLLIVEDNPEMSAFVQQILNPYFNCHAALDGTQALDIIDKTQPDLIISDLMMPNMDGFSFREKLAEHPKFRYTPFIMLTARAGEADKIKGFTLGVDDYISKPFSAPELIARVHNLLKNKLQRQALGSEQNQEEVISADEQILRTAEATVLEALDNLDFKVQDLAASLNYSPRQLSRILKKLSGMSPVEFILEIRLQKANQLIREQRYLSVAEVRYDIGIESASYFSKKFTERFGIAPSELLK